MLFIFKKDILEDKELILLSEYKKIAPIDTKIDINMLDENEIMEIYKNFNLTRERILS